MNIPFSKLTLGDDEKKAVCDVIDSGWVVMGKKTQEFEEKFAEYVGAKYAVFVDSATSALFLSLKYLQTRFRLYPHMFVPSLTFVSTAEAVVNSGAIPHFHDISRETFCMDESEFGGTIPVHLTGNRAKHKADIYDSAHRIMRDDVKGSDALWCYSFYATKNMTTIQGGMIALNDFDKYEWLKKARDHGITRGTTERYKEGKWEYDFDFVGWREKSDDVHAAIGLEQLKKLDGFNNERRRIISRYNERLGQNRTGLHLYPILVNERQKFIEFMQEKGVQCSVHFLPLHTRKAYKDFPREALPNTEYLGERLVSLPLFPQLTNEEVDYICQVVEDSKLLIHE